MMVRSHVKKSRGHGDSMFRKTMGPFIIEEHIMIGFTLQNETHHNMAFKHFNLEGKTQTKAFKYKKCIFQMNAIN